MLAGGESWPKESRIRRSEATNTGSRLTSPNSATSCSAPKTSPKPRNLSWRGRGASRWTWRIGVSGHPTPLSSPVFLGAKRLTGRSHAGYYLSFDIMADVVFGAHYNLLQNERFRYVVESIDKSNVRMSCLIQFPEFARLKIDKYIFRQAIVARNRFIKFVTRVVGERLGKIATENPDKIKTEDADVFGNLAAAKDPETGEGFTLNEIAAESTTLVVAGADTSSVAFAAMLFYLADNRNAYDRAAAEVRSKFQSPGDIAMGSDLASCNYLYACINEALRMSPPVGLALWREVATGNFVVDGQAVEAGCDVGVPLYSIHHDPKYYSEPFEYRPERWLVDDGTGSVERARSAFNPFSVGMRSCLGKSLALTEMALTAATILLTGDFRFAEGPKRLVGRGRKEGAWGRHRDNEYQLFDHITGQKDGPFLQFSRRLV